MASSVSLPTPELNAVMGFVSRFYGKEKESCPQEAETSSSPTIYPLFLLSGFLQTGLYVKVALVCAPRKLLLAPPDCRGCSGMGTDPFQVSQFTAMGLDTSCKLGASCPRAWQKPDCRVLLPLDMGSKRCDSSCSQTEKYKLKLCFSS